MSQQLQITGGAKVRNLDGVITGSTGVLGSLPINGANGIPQLDSSGKILVSQLPNSVMEYKGTWNVATNTPYLVNGTGNAGDVYIVTGAATGGTTHDFGAGPILFYNGDQTIYDGSAWQRAAGSSGTVTSVGVTESGDALSITGSPITTSGTINIGFAGTSAQYVAGDGSLITFPTIVTQAQNLVTEVYNETGATLTKGTVVYINGGHGNLPTVTKALATSDATSAQTYGVVRTDITNNNNGYVTVIGNLDNLDTQAYAAGTQLYLSSTTAGAWTDVKQYAPAHLVYVGVVVRSHPTQGVVEIKIQNGYELDELHNVSAQTPSNNQGLFYNSSNSLWENKSIATALGYTPANDSLVVHLAGPETITGAKTFTANNLFTTYPNRFTEGVAIKETAAYGVTTGYTTISGATNGLSLYLSGTGIKTFGFASASSNNTYTFPNASGTIALTSDIPSLTGYVPYTGATTNVDLGTHDLTAYNIYSSYLFGVENNLGNAYLGGMLRLYRSGTFTTDVNYSNIFAKNSTSLSLYLGSGTNYKQADINLSGLTNNTLRTYSLPDASGTIALTSDITSISATAPISYSAGVISISQATTSTNGYLSSTDWNTFNGKQNALTNPVTGTGASGQVTYFNGSTTVTCNNNFFWDSGNSRLGIGTTTPSTRLHVVGDIYSTTGMFIGNSGGYFMTLNTLNGMYIDSTNYLTFNTNGTEKLRLTSAGNLGIGTSSPSYQLHLYRNTADNISQVIANAYLNQGNLINFQQNKAGSTINAYIGHGGDNTGNFIINNGGGERMTITPSGNVGIGTTSPSSLLHVSKAGYMGQTWSNTAVSGISAYLNIYDTTYGIAFGTDQSAPLAFITNASERMRITSGGNVLINRSASVPGIYKLVVNTGTDLNIGFGVQGGEASIESYNDAVNASRPLRIYSTALSVIGGTSYFAGNVGIGTTTPGTLLDLYKTSYPVFQIGSGTVSGNMGIDTGSNFLNVGTTTNHSMVFATNNTERMRITNQGSVLVGGTSSVYYSNTTRGVFEVNGSSQAIMALTIGGTSTNGAYIYHDSTTWYLNNAKSGASTYVVSSTNGVYLASGGTSWTSASDIRLKNITGNIENAVDSLMTLRTIKHTWKSDKTNKQHLALIAQEVEKIFPEVIDKNKLPKSIDGNNDETEYLGVRYTELVPVLIKAIQELKAEIEQLKNK